MRECSEPLHKKGNLIIARWSIIIGILLIVFGFVFRLIANSLKQDRILTHGETAAATILEMTNIGTRVNHEPVLKFRLRVQSSDGHTYDAETAWIISPALLGSLALGMNVPIQYDPKKLTEVALDLEALQAIALEKAKREEDDEETLTGLSLRKLVKGHDSSNQV